MLCSYVVVVVTGYRYSLLAYNFAKATSRFHWILISLFLFYYIWWPYLCFLLYSPEASKLQTSRPRNPSPSPSPDGHWGATPCPFQPSAPGPLLLLHLLYLYPLRWKANLFFIFSLFIFDICTTCEVVIPSLSCSRPDAPWIYRKADRIGLLLLRAGTLSSPQSNLAS